MTKEDLPQTIIPRKEFVPGKQVEVTKLINEISYQFEQIEENELFLKIHDWIYSYLKILPYGEDEETKQKEASRRWKLTADEVLKIKTVYEGKECNDVVMIFNAILKSLDYETKLAKVYKFDQEGQPIGHSISIVKNKKTNISYAINSGSKNNFWIEEGIWDFDSGSVLINGWYVWKIAEDQWSMGLTDASQEEDTIYNDARLFYATHLKFKKS